MPSHRPELAEGRLGEGLVVDFPAFGYCRWEGLAAGGRTNPRCQTGLSNSAYLLRQMVAPVGQ